MPCIENRASGGTEIRNASVCAQVMTGRRSTSTSAPLSYRDKRDIDMFCLEVTPS